MVTYLIAVKREKRSEITLAEAMRLISDIPGVKAQSNLEHGTARVSIRESDNAEFVRRLSPWCHIETLIRHTPNTLTGSLWG